MMASGADESAIIVCEGVKRSFGSTKALRGVDLRVAAGTLAALYGPSGSGKTTLLNLIGALDTPTAGKITLSGVDISALREGRRAKLRRQKFGFIFQNYTLMPTYTALENLDLALRLAGIGFFERRRRAKNVLETVGLSAWASHVPDELSGGQRQRVAIARALCVQPAIVLADEPTSGLDTRTAKRILGLFRHIAHEQGTTFVIVSHDPLVAAHVDAAYDLNDGKLELRRNHEINHSHPLHLGVSGADAGSSRNNVNVGVHRATDSSKQPDSGNQHADNVGTGRDGHEYSTTVLQSYIGKHAASCADLRAADLDTATFTHASADAVTDSGD
jgi:ABC-type lipoprotein export system ATPase subunit